MQNVIARSPAERDDEAAVLVGKDKLKAPSQSRGWIATARLAGLAMTRHFSNTP